MYKLDITIPSLPKRFNTTMGRHWSIKHLETKKWMLLMGASVRWNRPKDPLKKAKLKLIRGSSVAPDYDGLVQSFKICIDCLIKLNIIDDDNIGVIGKPDYEWVKTAPKKGFIRVIVEESGFENLHTEAAKGRKAGAAEIG